jgi:hypothetical protein
LIASSDRGLEEERISNAEQGMMNVEGKYNFDLLINENNQLIWKLVEIINTSRENNQKTS